MIDDDDEYEWWWLWLYRDWKEHLEAGDIQNVSRYLRNGFDINTDIGIVWGFPMIKPIKLITSTSLAISFFSTMGQHNK